MQAFGSGLQPIETAQGLPNSCYTDPVMFKIEKIRYSLQTGLLLVLGLMCRFLAVSVLSTFWMMPAMLANRAMSMQHKFQMRDNNYQNLRACQKNETGLLNIAHFFQMFCLGSTKTKLLPSFFYQKVRKSTLNA